MYSSFEATNSIEANFGIRKEFESHVRRNVIKRGKILRFESLRNILWVVQTTYPRKNPSNR